jgi:L-lactate dehydrogenase complex protein LldE
MSTPIRRPEPPGSDASGTSGPEHPRVGLFITCLADIYRPTVGLATVALLESAGCRVEVPEGQACCGQPSYNNGDVPGAARTARQIIETFEAYDYVVAPSGSCAGMLRDYPRLFETDPDWQMRARSLSERTHELISFLADVRGMKSVDAAFPHSVTYHDSCHGLRALGIKAQPGCRSSTRFGTTPRKSRTMSSTTSTSTWSGSRPR